MCFKNNSTCVIHLFAHSFFFLQSPQVATHVDMNFMRAKSVRLFAEARQLTSMWNGSASSIPHCIELLDSTAYYSIIDPSPPPLWFDRYWKLIEQIHSHLGLLQPAALKVSFIPDYHNIGLALKHSTILALAALADLHAPFAPSHPESSSRYRETVCEIVSISSTFKSDDFQYLAPILSVRDLNDALASTIYLLPSCVGRLRPRGSLKIGSCTKTRTPLSPRSDNAIRI
jgi:hypothetical protein